MGASVSSTASDVPHSYDWDSHSTVLTPEQERSLALIVQAGRSNAAILRYAVVPLDAMSALPIYRALALTSARARSYLARAAAQWARRGGRPDGLRARLEDLARELAEHDAIELSVRAGTIAIGAPASMLIGALTLDAELIGEAYSRPAAMKFRDALAEQVGRIYKGYPPTTLERLDVEAAVRAARDFFICCFIRLSVYRAIRVRSRSRLQYADLVQSGNEGLIHAVDHFDPHYGVPFGAYAFMWIKKVISRAERYGNVIALPDPLLEVRGRIRRASADAAVDGEALDPRALASELGVDEAIIRAVIRAETAAVSLDGTPGHVVAETCVDDRSPDLEEHVRLRERREAVARALATCPPRGRQLMERYFGIGREAESVPKIARSLGLTPQRCYQIKETELRRLRRPAIASELIDHV